MRTKFVIVLMASIFSLCLPSRNVLADIMFDRRDGFIILRGSFESSDDPGKLAKAVRTSGATAIGFDSDGGNVIKAMEYGRIIRTLRLDTMQIRGSECASACALAFMGGVKRVANPGSIGVHQLFFPPDKKINSHAAVAATQWLTTEIMAYMTEMGINSQLIQLMLSIDADDIHYLTKNEMEGYALAISVPAKAPQQVPLSNRKEYDAKLNAYKKVVAAIITDNAHGRQFLTEEKRNWDAATNGKFFENPNLLKILYEQKKSGIYDKISAEIARRRATGDIAKSMPFIDAYLLVGNELRAHGKFNQSKK